LRQQKRKKKKEKKMQITRAIVWKEMQKERTTATSNLYILFAQSTPFSYR
jgi:hypothetical protein